MSLRRASLLAATVLVVLPVACRNEPEFVEPVNATTAETATVVDRQREEEERAAAERRRWLDELAVMENRQAALGREHDDRKSALAESKGRLRERKEELSRQKAETDAYIQQHELQVACAYADEAAVDTTGEYSEQTKKCAQTVSIYCSVPMVIPSFRRKVQNVRRHIDDANARAKSLKAEISREEKKIAAQQEELRMSQLALDRIESEVLAMRQKLGGAQDLVRTDPSSL